jgi:hypothetical protein
MPYVTDDLRDRVELYISDIIFTADMNHKNVTALSQTVAAILVELVTKAMEPATGWRYHHLHRAYGVFIAAAAEAERRLGQQLELATPGEFVCLSDYHEYIETIVYWVRNEDDDKRDGYLNYIVSNIAAECFGGPYDSYTANVLRLAGQMFYDDVIAPYEDAAIKNNGDIPPYRRHAVRSQA